MKNLIITVVPISCQRSLIKNNGKCWNAKRMVCHESVCPKKRFSLSDCASVTPKFYREVSAKCVSFKQCSCHKNLTEIPAIPEFTETTTKLPEINGNSTVKCDLTERAYLCVMFFVKIDRDICWLWAISVCFVYVFLRNPVLYGKESH